MTVHRLQPRPSRHLLQLIAQRRWPELAAAVDAGASPHAPASGRLCLFDWFMSKVGLLPEDDEERASQRQAMEAFIRAWPGPDPERLPPVVMAALSGRADFVSMLLAAGHDPNGRGVDGHNAASAIAVAHIRAPLRLDRQRVAPEVSWDEPLVVARLAALGVLGAKGMDLDRPAWKGAPPLLLAILAKHTPVARFLLASGAHHTPAADLSHPDMSALYRLSTLEAAITTCNENVASALIYAGADCLQPSTLAPRVVGSLVELAGGLGQPGMLAAMRARLPATHPAFVQAFSYALEMGNLEVVEWGLAHGCTIDMPLPDGRRPAHIAAARGHEVILMQLLAAGVDMQALDGRGANAWDLLERHHPDIHARLQPVHARGTILPFRRRQKI